MENVLAQAFSKCAFQWRNHKQQRKARAHQDERSNSSGLHTTNLSWKARVGKLKLACEKDTTTVGKHVEN